MPSDAATPPAEKKTPVEAVGASTVLLVRDGDSGLEVFLIKQVPDHWDEI